MIKKTFNQLEAYILLLKIDLALGKLNLSFSVRLELLVGLFSFRKQR